MKEENRKKSDVWDMSPVYERNEIDQPALIPHISEASSLKYTYEVLFRSLHKLLMDTATSEYLFWDDFFRKNLYFMKFLQVKFYK
ncbi:hypothetical protein Patl1_10733 [Pistacia atlantica]|uniref:Uncharacterized protein n=1 Tax=Pistacia atlantica TaxID=434234 RepID=A0ACC1A5T6_9ROSI|nr:hypothetical protein Patl1_10733 [Pistacia atlantica]